MITDAKDVFFNRINELYQRKTPFFFLTDYHGRQMEVSSLEELKAESGEGAPDRPRISFQSPGLHFPADTLDNHRTATPDRPLKWQKKPITYGAYKCSFDIVSEGLQKGNSYLVNLTCSTGVQTNYSLAELYELGQGKYKLLYGDQFVHFSPEPFIRIDQDQISSFPMKGTLEENELTTLNDLLLSEKEIAEQFTIVDLIRNDLHQVASNVKVESFRYIEKIKTNQKNLFTVSSHITGTLRPEYKDRPGDILKAMLPAGSITGAPKAATMQIIQAAETHNRNYYTGVWGYYNGEYIDSCVIIRYLENTEQGLIFKSGGGITSLSDPLLEYQEMQSKVYVPLP